MNSIRYEEEEIITLRSTFFSLAIFRAKGDAKTRSPFDGLGCSFIGADAGVGLLVTSSFFGASFSFFSGLGAGASFSSGALFFGDAGAALPSS